MELKELLDKCINDRLIDLTISGQKVKNEEGVMRVKIRPVQLKDEIKYQASEFVGRKVLHTNYSEEEIKTRITEYMENTFKQAQFKYIVNSYGGLRVSRSALRFNDDQERGVFVVVGGKLVFKKINVEYWGDDYLICTQEDDGDYLKLYDRIVTEGKDLYEGKVVE